MKHWPFSVTAKDDDRPVISIEFMGEVVELVPEQVSALVLLKMKETAEAYLGELALHS